MQALKLRLGAIIFARQGWHPEISSRGPGQLGAESRQVLLQSEGLGILFSDKKHQFKKDIQAVQNDIWRLYAHFRANRMISQLEYDLGCLLP